MHRFGFFSVRLKFFTGLWAGTVCSLFGAVSHADIPPLQLASGEFSAFNLATIEDLDFSAVAVTNLGSFTIQLRNDVAPAAVNNFLRYLTDGEYINNLIHRSIPDFVVQAGGFRVAPTGNQSFEILGVETRNPIAGNPTLSNARGTVAMALVANDPDSATSQWYVNVGDNTHLDDDFTVFGEIDSAGMEVIDAINALDAYQFDAGSFASVPLFNYEEGEPVLIDNLVVIQPLQWIDPIQVTGNTAPTLYSAQIRGASVGVTSLGGAGQARITLRIKRQGSIESLPFTVYTPGEGAISGFGPLTFSGLGDPVSSPTYGSLIFGEQGFSRTFAFSSSLQTWLATDGVSVFSSQYGQLTPTGFSQWVDTQFFGRVHLGVDGAQYGGWVNSARFDWMRFQEAGNGERYLWVHHLQTWLAVNSDGSFHSFDFGFFNPVAGSLTRYNTRIGIVTAAQSNPRGWLISDRFGFVWFARDGTGVWFWSTNRNEWIGITAGGGLWSTAEGRFLD